MMKSTPATTAHAERYFMQPHIAMNRVANSEPRGAASAYFSPPFAMRYSRIAARLVCDGRVERSAVSFTV